VLVSKDISRSAGWEWRCAAGTPVLEWWIRAPDSPHPQTNPGRLVVSWATWEQLWAELDATNWNDLYDECDGDASDSDTNHLFEIVVGDHHRDFSCAGTTLPAPFPQIARAIRSQSHDASELAAPLNIAASQHAAVRPSEVEDWQIGDCEGMKASLQVSATYDAHRFTIQCYGERVVYQEAYADLSGWQDPAKPQRLSKESWARLWSTLASLDWRHLPSSCPSTVPDDQAFRTKAIELSITDQHGSRTFSCYGWKTLPDPHAALLEALEAVTR
jgi:hypothetical protein